MALRVGRTAAQKLINNRQIISRSFGTSSEQLSSLIKSMHGPKLTEVETKMNEVFLKHRLIERSRAMSEDQKRDMIQQIIYVRGY